MNGGLLWPDLIIGAILIFAGFSGYKRGFVSEITGLVALAAALIAPWYYTGGFDSSLAQTFHLPESLAHPAGMLLTAIIAFVLVLALGWVLNRFAKLPLVNIANALAGLLVGCGKGALVLWLVLYVALLFPIPPLVRADLRHARFVHYFADPDPLIDGVIMGAAPFARPMLEPLFARHRI